MKSLFKNNINTVTSKPLAETIRPTNLSDVFGQEHLFDSNSLINNMILSNNLQNIILWGPAGSGKTTLARIIAKNSKYHSQFLSAVVSGTPELKQLFIEAVKRKQTGIRTILIVDEIHHFNKTQQDIFLPYLEDGTIVLIGATTENPSFELNSALLSRSTVLTLKALDNLALAKIVARAEEVYHKKLPLQGDDLNSLFAMVAGDGRYLLNICENLFAIDSENISSKELLNNITPRAAIYDKSKDAHHHLVSAFHKSIRGSDANASLYWLHRMLNAGGNPHYILRRLVRIASEDIGLADPQALLQVIAAKDAYDFLGSPEGDLAIAQATLYLATAAKSNAIYTACKKANDDAGKYANLSPPAYILNAPTKLMKEQGYGKGYIYDHDTLEGFSGQDYLPSNLPKTNYYQPSSRGYEKEITKRLEYWHKLRLQKNM